jgi:5-formyltetrahydrofolate cyclo-ligase
VEHQVDDAPDPTDEKRRLRSELASVAQVGAEETHRVVDNLFEFLSSRLPGTISTYRALGDEVALDDLIERLPGWRWVLPRVEDDGSLTWRDARIPLERHRWGMEQPAASGPVVPTLEIDVFLVPGLSFDPTGARLGRGGGFYDRELAAKRGDALSIGVTVERRVVGRLPTELHDVPVQYLVTERGARESIPTRQHG